MIVCVQHYNSCVFFVNDAVHPYQEGEGLISIDELLEEYENKDYFIKDTMENVKIYDYKTFKPFCDLVFLNETEFENFINIVALYYAARDPCYDVIVKGIYGYDLDKMVKKIEELKVKYKELLKEKDKQLNATSIILEKKLPGFSKAVTDFLPK